MSSKVDTQKAGPHRPSWNYRGGKAWVDQDNATLQMLESIRNVCEDIQKSQTLQCDVAHAIKDLAKSVRVLRRDLKKKGIL